MPANKNILLILGVVAFIAVLAGGAYLYLASPKNQGYVPRVLREALNFSETTPTPAPYIGAIVPPRIKTLPTGRQEYSISHGANVTGPKPFRAVIDPLTPTKGQKQTVQLALTSDAEIAEAKIILHTDNKKTDYPLTLINGNAQNGTWEASWTMDDSYDHNYYIQFYLKSGNGLFQNGLRFRQ